MHAALLGLLAPALFGQVQVPLGGAGRGGIPPIVIQNPAGGSGLSSRPLEPLNLNGTLPNIRTPELNIPGNGMPGGSYSVPGSVGSTSGGNTSSAGSWPAETTASREEDYSMIATPSGMVPPPPQDVHEAPPDGGDDDDDDEKKGSTSFDWGKTIGLIVIGALFLYGVTRP